MSAIILFISILSIYFALPSLIEDCKYLPGTKVNLGLDLRGGVSLVLEVDDESYYKEKLVFIADSFVRKLRKKGISIFSSATTGESSEIITEKELSSEEIKYLKGLELQEGYVLNIMPKVLKITPENDFKVQMRSKLLSQSMSIIMKRIDETGTKEIDLQRQGLNKILLQIPGVYNTSQIKSLIGKTAKLTFHLVDGSLKNDDIRRGNIPLGTKLLKVMDNEKYDNNILPIKAQALMSGEVLIDAHPTKNQLGQYVVQFRLNNEGAKIFADITSRYKGHALAIVMDKQIVSAPRINEAIPTGAGVISGDFDAKSANEFAILLRSGALPTQLKVSEERVVGPTLGKASIDAGVKAVIVAGVLVVAMMIVFYGYWGILASVALIVNLFMILAILGLMDATLTMPGIGGIALTLGMAVDANILIFERIKEEKKAGNGIVSSIVSGYKNSMATIMDANITTIAAALILYVFGTASVRGFSVTLTVGIVCSMFTSIFLTKSIVYSWRRIFSFKGLGL